MIRVHSATRKVFVLRWQSTIGMRVSDYEIAFTLYYAYENVAGGTAIKNRMQKWPPRILFGVLLLIIIFCCWNIIRCTV